MYDEQDFTAMPILADALEDAGCTNEEVLAHCRGEGRHVRGCWVVDALVGDAFQPRVIPKPDPWKRLSESQRSDLIHTLHEFIAPKGQPVETGEYPPGVVSRAPLVPLDTLALLERELKARARRRGGIMVAGIFGVLGALTMLAETPLTGLVVMLVGLPFLVLAFGEDPSSGSVGGQTMKELITGTVESRERTLTIRGVRHVLRISGVDVTVPPEEFDRFPEGWRVRVARTYPGNVFLSAEVVSAELDDANAPTST
jgi:hypothetical protein